MTVPQVQHGAHMHRRLHDLYTTPVDSVHLGIPASVSTNRKEEAFLGRIPRGTGEILTPPLLPSFTPHLKVPKTSTDFYSYISFYP